MDSMSLNCDISSVKVYPNWILVKNQVNKQDTGTLSEQVRYLKVRQWKLINKKNFQTQIETEERKKKTQVTTAQTTVMMQKTYR